MSKIYLLVVTAFLVLNANGQTIADFENLSIPQDSFLNGSDMMGGFSSGNIFVPNDFNANFNSYNGWAISNTTDTLTTGLDNQYSAVTGGGYQGSSNYAVVYAFSPTTLSLTGPAAGKQMNGLYITNSTWGYLGMRDGTQFSKSFGGATGDDPDFFLLTIKKYKDGMLSTDSIDFYLADFRFADNSQDYFVKEWTFIDLTVLGDVDSLQFELRSSDSGMFGMNNPAYFCIDNVETRELGTANSVAIDEKISLFPNPASNFLGIKGLPQGQFQASIFDLQGKLIMNQELSDQEFINIETLNTGLYSLKIKGEDFVHQGKFLKR